jgi:signal transduction histidine kinase
MYRPHIPATDSRAGASEPSALDVPAEAWPTGAWNVGTWLSGVADDGGEYVAVVNRDLQRARDGTSSSSLGHLTPGRHSGSRDDLAALNAARLATLRQHLATLADPVGFLAHFFEAAPVGLAVWETDGHVLLANQAVRELFGTQPPPDYSIFKDHIAHTSGMEGAMRRAFGGETVALPTAWYNPRALNSSALAEDQRLAISATLFPVRDRDGGVEFVAAVYRDDTEAMLAQQQLRAQSEQLEQRVANRTAQLAEANEELEAFSYSVSHDLRAPLRTIDAFASLLAEDRDSKLSPMAQDNLRRIRGATLRMSNLINDLLDFSRLGKQALDVKPVSPAHLVQQVLQELEPKLHGRDIKVAVKKLPSCQADPALLREVFLNLIDNAIKFSAKTAAARIEVGSRIQDGQLVWYVSDNGVGFDMAHYERLFGVFSRLHSVDEFEGTGVGLALVHRVVKRHGGEIWAYAEPGKGATFYFSLGE